MNLIPQKCRFVDPLVESEYRRYAELRLGKEDSDYRHRLPYLHRFGFLISGLSIKNICWSLVIEWAFSDSDMPCNELLRFIYQLIDHEVYSAPDMNDLIACREHIEPLAYNRAFKKMCIRFPAEYLTIWSFLKTRGSSRVVNFIIPHANESIHNLVDKFLKDCTNKKYSKYPEHCIFKLIFEKNAMSLNEYNDSSFTEHFNILRPVLQLQTNQANKIFRTLINFYLYIITTQNENGIENNFHIYNTQMLLSSKLHDCLLNGFTPVLWSPFSPCPSDNKLLIVSTISMRGASESESFIPVKIDFTEIKNEEIRKFTKDWFWERSECLTRRKRKLSILLCFIRFEQSLFQDASKTKITAAGLIKYYQYITSQEKSPSYIQIVKGFLLYVIEQSQSFCLIDKVFINYYLTSSDPNPKQLKKYYTENEISALAKAYHNYVIKMKGTKDYDRIKLCEWHFYLLASTNLRSSSIRDLDVDCCEPCSQRADVLWIKCKSKTSGFDEQKTLIKASIKKLIDKIIEDTAETRSISTDLKNKLFIYQGLCHRKPKILDDGYVIKLHKIICHKYSIRYLPIASALRATKENHINQSVHELFPDADPSVLTGHTNSIQRAHYTEPMSASKFNEKYYNVTLSGIAVCGSVKQTTISNPSNTVSYGCGHCESACCNGMGPIYCLLLCRHFVVTPADRPIIEQRIHIIDNLLFQELPPHERENLQIQKKALVLYLSKIDEISNAIVTCNPGGQE